MDFSNSSVKTTDEISLLCSQILDCNRNLAKSTIDRRSDAVFRIQTKVWVFPWYISEGILPNRAEPEHLLWALSFLKWYEAEESRATPFLVDEKTIRKWTKIFVTAINELNLLSCFFASVIYLTLIFLGMLVWPTCRGSSRPVLLLCRWHRLSYIWAESFFVGMVQP